MTQSPQIVNAGTLYQQRSEFRRMLNRMTPPATASSMRSGEELDAEEFIALVAGPGSESIQRILPTPQDIIATTLLPNNRRGFHVRLAEGHEIKVEKGRLFTVPKASSGQEVGRGVE